jgi:predicted PurR-regulated permease PerM
MNKMAVTRDDHTLVMQDTRVPVPRWVQLVALPLAVLFLWAILRAAGPVLLLFIIGALVALLLNPFVMVPCRAGSRCCS